MRNLITGLMRNIDYCQLQFVPNKVFETFFTPVILAQKANRKSTLLLFFSIALILNDLDGQTECGCSNFQIVGTTSESVTNISGVTLLPHYCLDVRGTLIINEPTQWSGLGVIMREGSEIVLDDDITISDNSFITGCGTMWKGIRTQEGTKLTITDSRIEGAEFGIKLESGSELICHDDDFVNNIIGISVGSPFNGDDDFAVISQESAITGCTFYTDGYLPDPYPGQYYYDEGWPDPNNGIVYNKGFAALYLENSRGVTLGSTEGSARNEVYNMRNGVIVINSNCYVAGTDFHDFTGQFPFGSIHIGIRETNQVGVYSDHSVVNVEKNGMVGIMVGVWGTESSDFIANNGFHIYNGETGTDRTKGIHEVKPQSLSIINNKIYDGFTGIRLENGTRPFLIQSNLLFRSVTIQGNEGIHVSDYHILGRSPGLIYQNQFQIDDGDQATGIGMVTVTGIRALDNDPIQFNYIEGIGNKNAGIVLFDGTACVIGYNVITADPEYDDPGNTDNNTYNSGIEILKSKMNSLYCNDIENFNANIHIIGTNSMTQLRANTIRDGDYGLELLGPCSLGIQDQEGNEWLGDYDHYGAHITAPNDDDILKTAIYSAFIVDNGDDLGIYRPHPIGPEIVEHNEWFNNFAGTGKTCLTISNPINITGIGSNKFIRRSFEFDNFDDEMHWLAYADMYDLVLKYDSLLAYYAVDSFFSVQEPEVLGNLMFIRDKLSRIPDESFEIKHNLDSTLQKLTKDLEDIDSIVFTDPVDKQDWLDLRLLKTDTIVDSLALWRDILSTEDVDFLDAVDDALDVLDGLTPTNDLEDYLKQTLSFKADLILGNELSGGDIEDIEDMLELCPWQGGYALGTDFSLYTSITDVLPGYNIYPCISPEPLLQPFNQHTATQENLQVFPNPANNELILSSRTLMQEVSLFDLTSKLILKFNPNSLAYHLDVSDITPGLYILNLTTTDGVHPLKIVIQR